MECVLARYIQNNECALYLRESTEENKDPPGYSRIHSIQGRGQQRLEIGRGKVRFPTSSSHTNERWEPKQVIKNNENAHQQALLMILT